MTDDTTARVRRQRAFEQAARYEPRLDLDADPDALAPRPGDVLCEGEERRRWAALLELPAGPLSDALLGELLPALGWPGSGAYRARRWASLVLARALDAEATWLARSWLAGFLLERGGRSARLVAGGLALLDNRVRTRERDALLAAGDPWLREVALGRSVRYRPEALERLAREHERRG